MKTMRLSLFLFATMLSILSGVIVGVQVTARAVTPDRLEIMRTVGHGHTPAHEMVTQARPVQDLYRAMLSLPAAPADEICPEYIIANYQLTFFVHNTVVQKANALRGMCQPVTLGNNDVRVANTKFWTLMNKAIVVGKPVTTPAGTSTPTPVKTFTSTPVTTSSRTPTPTPGKVPSGTSTPTPDRTPTSKPVIIPTSTPATFRYFITRHK